MMDAVVHEPIIEGEPITDRKVVRAGAAGVLAATLDPGMRAMAVPLSAESAAGGFILPGDHVDVVQSRQVEVPGGTDKKFASGSVLRNVKVLAHRPEHPRPEAGHRPRRDGDVGGDAGSSRAVGPVQIPG